MRVRVRDVEFVFLGQHARHARVAGVVEIGRGLRREEIDQHGTEFPRGPCPAQLFHLLIDRPAVQREFAVILFAALIENLYANAMVERVPAHRLGSALVARTSTPGRDVIRQRIGEIEWPCPRLCESNRRRAPQVWILRARDRPHRER